METSNLKNKLCKANFIVFLAGYQTQLQVLDQNHYYGRDFYDGATKRKKEVVKQDVPLTFCC